MALSNPRKILLPIFFLSGFSALVYEVIWARMLSLAFGSTFEAVSAVVTAFMAGLAFGSYFMGKWIDKKGNTLLIYSITELGIGILSLSLYFIIISIPDIHSAFHKIIGIENSIILFHGTGYILEFLLVFVPATLMGATFPLMVKSYISSRNHIGEGMSIIYTYNTLGAVFGAFLTGFLLIPAIGIRSTVYTAVSINLLLAAAAYTIRTSHARTIPASVNNHFPFSTGADCHISPANSTPPLIAASVLIVLTLSGFASLAYQIAWTRVLTMVIGNSVYAFSTILTTFLLGITIGSFAFIRQIDRVKDKVRLLGILQLLLCISVLTILPAIDSLPALFLLLFRTLPANFLDMVAIEFIVAFSVILIPTILIGASFPVAARIYIGAVDHIGEGLGRLYSANTVGAIFGSFLTGFVFIPVLGTEKTILYISGLNLLCGIMLTAQAEGVRRTLRIAVPVASLIFFSLYAVTVHRWDINLLNRGVYLYADWLEQLQDAGIPLKDVSKEFKILSYEEGREATVAVTKTDRAVSLQINGKTDAGTGKDDMTTQIMLGMLPLIVHPKPENVAVVGLGSGITLGAVETFPVKKIDCIEILPEVVKANRFFSSFNHDALNDPRVNLVIDDARRYLSITNNRYDVIISEPSNPWITGVSNLFTLEFFKIAKKGLKDNGIMCQWIHLYSIDTRELKTLLNTFNTVFPHVSVWFFPSSDLIILGSNTLHSIDDARLNSIFDDDVEKREMLRAGFGGPEDVKKGYLMGTKEVKRFYQGAGLNTDNNPVIEFEAPKALYRSTEEKNMRAILSSIRENR